MKPPYKASSSMDVLLALADTLLLCVKVRLGTYNVANPCHQICLFRVLGGRGSALSSKNSDVSFVGLQYQKLTKVDKKRMNYYGLRHRGCQKTALLLRLLWLFLEFAVSGLPFTVFLVFGMVQFHVPSDGVCGK